MKMIKFKVRNDVRASLTCVFGIALVQVEIYGIQLSHIFEIPSISSEKASISIEIPSILIKNLGFQSKYWICLVFHTLNLKF